MIQSAWSASRPPPADHPGEVNVGAWCLARVCVSALYRGSGRATVAHGTPAGTSALGHRHCRDGSAVLGCWRWTEFHNDVVRLREAGHMIDVVEESRGVFERRVTVTAEIGTLNLLLGEDLQRRRARHRGTDLLHRRELALGESQLVATRPTQYVTLCASLRGPSGL